MKHKVFKQTFVVTVLSEDGPYDPHTIGEIAYDIVDGSLLGQWERVSSEEVPDLPTLEKECWELGSQVEYFTELWDEEE